MSAHRHPPLQPLASRNARGISRGFTLVELLVGLAISLMLMAGAFTMAGLQVGAHHRLLLELQMQQELRATAELILRDLRRAAFWDRPQEALWQADAPAPVRNPYADLDVGEAGTRVTYSFSRDGNSAGGTGVREVAGFRWSEGRIDQLVAGRYQPLTDPALLRVRAFDLRVDSQARSLGDACARACSPGTPPPAPTPTDGGSGSGGGTDGRGGIGSDAPACGPAILTRLVELVLDAEAVHDHRVRQQLTVRGLVRNDALAGDCP